MTNLELNDDELRVVKEALKAYTHLQLGSFSTAADRVLMRAKVDPRAVNDAREGLKFAQECITGHRDGGPGICNPDVSNDARIARRLEALLTGDDVAVGLYNPDVSNDARIARRLEALLTGDDVAVGLYNRDGTVRD